MWRVPCSCVVNDMQNSWFVMFLTIYCSIFLILFRATLRRVVNIVLFFCCGVKSIAQVLFALFYTVSLISGPIHKDMELLYCLCGYISVQMSLYYSRGAKSKLGDPWNPTPPSTSERCGCPGWGLGGHRFGCGGFECCLLLHDYYFQRKLQNAWMCIRAGGFMKLDL